MYQKSYINFYYYHICEYVLKKDEINLINYGSYLGVKGQNFVLSKDGKIVKEIPFYKLNQILYLTL